MKNNTFKIKLNAGYFSKGDIISTSSNIQVVVVKVYKFNWWRKLLLKLGFSVKFHEVRVITENES